jgi:hypothetical protein
MDMNYASKGVSNAGLVTGIIGSALGLLNGGLGNLGLGFGREGGCHQDHFVNRYEMSLIQELAQKDSAIALRDANTYNDKKTLEMYQYIDGRLRGIEGQIAQQAVFNQKTVDDVALMNERLCCEAKERKCADNTIVNYVNATFYPKLVADVTTGTTTTAQVIYNPLPSCGCNCG